jgi:hypothetical protein
VDYNAKMGVVDKVDMILSEIHSVRKIMKWYKKLFFYLLDLSIYNTYILYQNATGKKQKFNEFHLSLLKKILQKYPQNKIKIGGGKRDSENLPFCLTEKHYAKCLGKVGNL